MIPGIIAAIAYGILALVGGIIGYIQAKSKASLISGIVSGLVLILSAIVWLQGAGWGSVLAAVVTAVLIIVFVVRFAKTRKVMPAGLMIATGGIALAVILLT